MFRFIAILLVSILLITLLKSIIGVIMRGFSDLLQGGSGAQQTAGPSRPAVPMGGELKRDPVCGTYVSTGASVTRSVNGQVLHFCSQECRDKYRVA